MPLVVVRRGIVLGLAFVLAIAGTALADDLRADADPMAGVQGSLLLGEVAPGSKTGVDVGFVVTCKTLSHLTPGATLAVDVASTDIPVDGALEVTPGQVVIPAQWPSTGAACTGDEPAPTVTPAHLTVTAPTNPGTGYSYTVFFGLPDGETTGNAIIAITVYLDVVVPQPPADTTDPVLHGVPSDIEVTTTGTGAVVTWRDPSATDDTDANPSVACLPASGSTFALGTTRVTCTATDASGNTATASFNVTVAPAQATPVGTWGRPLSDAMPALVGHIGRTIPLKLDLTVAGQRRGPGDIASPTLLVQRLSACAANADTTSMRPGGTFAWVNGQWQLSLDTTGLATGCVRLLARVDGTTAATAVIQLGPDAATTLKGNPKH